jgi:glycosyltransferase involved in cell wall biosynthesis
MTFTGFVPNVFEYILAADVCLAPMEQPEGLLTKVLDSISCSKPTVVMASAINGIPELTDGYNAMVAKDKKEFIQKTIYLLKNLGEAKVIGDRARKTLEEHYSWEFSKGKFIQTLGECIS